MRKRRSKKKLQAKPFQSFVRIPNRSVFIPFMNERGSTGRQNYLTPQRRPALLRSNLSLHEIFLSSKKLMYAQIPKNLRRRKKADELRDEKMFGKKIEFDSIGGQDLTEMHAGTKSLPLILKKNEENDQIIATLEKKEKKNPLEKLLLTQKKDKNRRKETLEFRDNYWIEDFNERLIQNKSKYSSLYINQIKRTNTKKINLRCYKGIKKQKMRSGRERPEFNSSIFFLIF